MRRSRAVGGPLGDNTFTNDFVIGFSKMKYCILSINSRDSDNGGRRGRDEQIKGQLQIQAGEK